MSDHAAETGPALRTRIWLAVGALLALGAALAFIVIPLVQGGAAGIDSVTAICRAFGILPGSPARATPVPHATPQPVTEVAWTVGTLAEIRGRRSQARR
jgi:hypothetical protein